MRCQAFGLGYRSGGLNLESLTSESGISLEFLLPGGETVEVFVPVVNVVNEVPRVFYGPSIDVLFMPVA